ncbi:hypothetical protein HZZ02_10670 [Streptococcus danieliae]|nr:hypothetical protein [Streptococcus danieliae]
MPGKLRRLINNATEPPALPATLPPARVLRQLIEVRCQQHLAAPRCIQACCQAADLPAPR